MARRFRSLKHPAVRALLLGFILAGFNTAFAAPSPSPSASTPAPSPLTRPGADRKTIVISAPVTQQKTDEWTQASRLFEQLSPDQKKKFLDNLDQWKSMSPEEQELMRDRELFRREKIALEIQQALGKSGLHLDDDQRAVYILRYTQERRKIEEALHKEMDAKRQVMVDAMLARLKVEFSSPPPPPITPPAQ